METRHAQAYMDEIVREKKAKREQRTVPQILRELLLQRNIQRFKVEDVRGVSFECIEDLKIALRGMTDVLFSKELESDRNGRAEYPEGEVLAPLNLASWSLFAVNEKGSYTEPLSPLDCILVNTKTEEMEESHLNSTICETLDMTIDLEQMTAKSTEHHKDSDQLFIVKSKRNDRMKCKQYQTFDGSMFQMPTGKATQCVKEETGQYALKWWGSNGYCQPTPFEIVRVFQQMFDQRARWKMKDMPSARVDRIIEDYRVHVWENLLPLAVVLDPYQPLTEEDYFDPMNPTVCLVLWLLSVEPCFIAMLNNAIRTMDDHYLPSLGPLALALFWISQYTEEYRADRLQIGSEVEDSPLGHFCCASVLFRAAPLKPEWIGDWKDLASLRKRTIYEFLEEEVIIEVEDDSLATKQSKLETSPREGSKKTKSTRSEAWVNITQKTREEKSYGQWSDRGDEGTSGDDKPVAIQMQGFLSAAESFRMALRYGRSEDAVRSAWPIALFVICMQNYHGLPGLRLNHLDYSGHPQERETIFMEGVEMFVLAVEERRIEKFDPNDKFWWDFLGKTITIVYLFNTMRV